MPPLSASSPLALLLLIPVFFWLVTAIFQWLWNITMPDVFKLPEISFWKAFRLLLISGFLFGGSFIRFKSGG